MGVLNLCHVHCPPSVYQTSSTGSQMLMLLHYSLLELFAIFITVGTDSVYSAPQVMSEIESKCRFPASYLVDESLLLDILKGTPTWRKNRRIRFDHLRTICIRSWPPHDAAEEPIQPYNIQRVEVLRADLFHLGSSATEKFANYFTDFRLGD